MARIMKRPGNFTNIWSDSCKSCMSLQRLGFCNNWRGKAYGMLYILILSTVVIFGKNSISMHRSDSHICCCSVSMPKNSYVTVISVAPCLALLLCLRFLESFVFKGLL